MNAPSEYEASRIIRRILRVNHAGEHGAVAIYSSQIARARNRYPDILPWLQETLGHELKHREAFLKAMPERGAKPCRAMYVWRFGGAILGAATSVFGKWGVMVCTAAVERTVHGHLVEQIAFLEHTDAELADLVKLILDEEDEHLRLAESHHEKGRFAARVLSGIVACATEMLILISTRGDSRHLHAIMRRERT